MAIRTCTKPDNVKSANDCAKERPGDRFAPAVPVYFESVADGKVTIRVKKSGSSYDARDSPPLTPSPIDWNDRRLWTRCPSVFKENGDGTPVAGTDGTLCLREDLVNDNLLGYRPKWPSEGGEDNAIEYAEMRLYPTRVTVHGREMHSGSSAPVTLELFNELDVDPAREVTFKRGGMVVHVSEDVFERAHIGSPNARLLERAGATIHAPESTPHDIADAWKAVSRASDWLKRANGAQRLSDDYKRVNGVVNAVMKRQKAKNLPES